MPIDIVKFKPNQKYIKSLGFTKVKSLKDYKVLEETDEIKIRNKIENNKYQMLLNPHKVKKQDHLHFRRGGLNQVICKILKKKNIIVAFSINKIITPQEIGRVKQDIKLCKKYKVRVAIITLATNKYEMRNIDDLISFCKLLGISEKAFSTPA